MKQKVIRLHRPSDELDQLDSDIEAKIKELNRCGMQVIGITTSYIPLVQDNRNQVSVYLLIDYIG